jgi:DNA-binding response OmpR family regulator
MRVLIVEDDRELGEVLQLGLQREGHEVEWVEDGEVALNKVQQERPDLLLLDLGLPGRGGVKVMEAMQDRWDGTAVMVLTASSRVEDRVRCLGLGADDCIQKPFSFVELIARCRAVLRRRADHPRMVLRYAGIEMDRAERVVRYAGSSVSLTEREYRLLEHLMQRRGVCSSRQELLQEVWHGASDTTTNIVDVYVNYLRKKLTKGEGRRRESVVETVRGAGYRLRESLEEAPSKKPISRAVSGLEYVYAHGD